MAASFSPRRRISRSRFSPTRAAFCAFAPQQHDLLLSVELSILFGTPANFSTAHFHRLYGGGGCTCPRRRERESDGTDHPPPPAPRTSVGPYGSPIIGAPRAPPPPPRVSRRGGPPVRKKDGHSRSGNVVVIFPCVHGERRTGFRVSSVGEEDSSSEGGGAPERRPSLHLRGDHHHHHHHRQQRPAFGDIPIFPSPSSTYIRCLISFRRYPTISSPRPVRGVAPKRRQRRRPPPNAVLQGIIKDS